MLCLLYVGVAHTVIHNPYVVCTQSNATGVLLGQLAVKQETKASCWLTLGNMCCSPAYRVVSAVCLISRHTKVIKKYHHLVTVFLQCCVSIVWGLQDRIGSPLRDTCKKLVPLARPSGVLEQVFSRWTILVTRNPVSFAG